MQNFFLPLLLAVLVLMLFLNARRQRRAMQETQRLQNSLAPGDRVMTSSGLQGTVVDLADDTIDLEIAPGVHTTWVRAAVREKVKPAVEDVEPEDVEDDIVEADEHAEADEHPTVDEQPEASEHSDKEQPKVSLPREHDTTRDKGGSAH
jgi:preprotein translocase subunit YajC